MCTRLSSRSKSNGLCKTPTVPSGLLLPTETLWLSLPQLATKIAAAAAFGRAQPRQHNAFKIELGQRTLIRALHQAVALEIPT